MSHIHRGTSCPISSSPTATSCITLMTQYTPYHFLSTEKKVKMKVFYLLTVCFRSSVEPASLLGFSDQLEDPSYLFSKQNSQFQSKFQFQQTSRLLLRCVSYIHIRKIIWLVKRSVTSHGNSPKWNPACPSTSEFYSPMKFLHLLKVCARIYILHVRIFIEYGLYVCTYYC